jgi:hypothetical protein
MYLMQNLAQQHIADLLAEADRARQANLARGPRKLRRRKGRELDRVAATVPRSATPVPCLRASRHAACTGGA